MAVRPSPGFVYCHSHYAALTPELREQLRLAFGTAQWTPALQDAQAFARQTIDWRLNHVTGGSPC
jgi:hypothetical protein